MAPTESRRKAVHPANQEGLDRLYDKCEQASTAQSSKFVFAVRKAAKALQACPTAVTTVKEAKALRGVGDSLARIIVPKPTEMNIALSRASSVATTASTTANDAESSTTTTAKTKNLKPRKNNALSDGKIDAPKPSEKLKAYQNAVKESESLILPSDDWRVVLIVDGREHGWEKVLADLQMSGIPSEKRNLPIGDMAWIARSGTLEIMLGTIVERKEVNDLASSLFGTRYKEQRLRLQHCGLPQVILLVEGDTKEVSNCSHEALHMAMMETRVQLDFQVVRTRHLEETVRFLKSVHRRILQRAFPSAFSDGVTSSSSLPTFSSSGVNRKRRRMSIKKRHTSDRRSFEEMVFDTPPLPPFGASRFITYNELKCKVEKDREEGTKTIGGIFCRMLKQIPRISNSTVPPLVHAYPTPDALFRALDGLNVSDGKNLLADLETGTQRVGELRALEVYYTFMAGGDDSVITGSPPRATLTENLPNCDADISSIQEETTTVEQGHPESTNVVFAAYPKLPETQTLKSRTLSKDTPSIPSAEAIDLLDSPSPSSDESDGSFSSKIESSKSDHASSPKQRPLLGPCTSWKRSEIRGSPSLLMPSSGPSPGFAGRSVPGSIRNPGRKHPRSSAPARESIDSLDIEIAMLSRKPKRRSATLDSQSSKDFGMACGQKCINSQGANSSDSEEEPLEVRVRQLREKLNLVNEVVATKVNPSALIRKSTRPRVTSPVAREVSISEDDDSLRRIQQEIIELSD